MEDLQKLFTGKAGEEGKDSGPRDRRAVHPEEKWMTSSPGMVE
jgi:hypothetical protein